MYAENMDRFLDSLPDSNVIFLYFKFDRGMQEWVPHINAACKLWKTNACDEDIHIARPSGSDGFCYIYQTSEVDYTVFIDDAKRVAAFDSERDVGFASPLRGGSPRALRGVKLGNHLTIGLMTSFVTKRLLLATHKTTYEWDEEESVPHQTRTTYRECNLHFDDPVCERTPCIDRGEPADTTLGETYVRIAKDPALVQIIALFKKVYTDGSDGYRGGGCGGVHRGPRGGAFVLTGSNQRKKYLPTMHKGGSGFDGLLDVAGTSFLREFVEFVKNTVVEPASRIQPNLSNVVVISDKKCDGLMVRYNYGTMVLSHSDVCFVDIETTKRAFLFAMMSNADRSSRTTRNASSSIDAFSRITAPRPEIVTVYD